MTTIEVCVSRRNAAGILPRVIAGASFTAISWSRPPNAVEASLNVIPIAACAALIAVGGAGGRDPRCGAQLRTRVTICAR